MYILGLKVCIATFQESWPAYLWWWLQAWVSSLWNETSKSSEIHVDVSLQHISLGSKPGSFSASGSFPGPSNSSKPRLTCTLFLTQLRKLLQRTYHTLSHFEFLLLPRTQCLLGQPNATVVHPQSPELLAGGQGAQPRRVQWPKPSGETWRNGKPNGCANWPRAGCSLEEVVGLKVFLALPHLGQCPSTKIDSEKNPKLSENEILHQLAATLGDQPIWITMIRTILREPRANTIEYLVCMLNSCWLHCQSFSITPNAFHLFEFNEVNVNWSKACVHAWAPPSLLLPQGAV